MDMAKSKKQNLNTLYEHLASCQRLEPCYLIISSDNLLKDRAIDAILQKRFKGQIDEMALERCDAKTQGVRRALDGVQMPSFFGGDKIVILNHISTLKSIDIEQLVSYTAKPSQKSTLLLVDSKLDKRKKGWAKIVKSCFTLTLETPKDHEIPSWIRGEAKRKNIKLSSNAIDMLSQLVGNQLGLLNQYLEKLQIAAPDCEIDVDTVMQHVVDTKERSVFDLVAAISSRNLSQQLACLAPLLEQNQSPIGIVAMITREVRILLGVKVGMLKHMSDTEISQRSGARGFFLQRYKNGAKNYQYQELIAFHRACYEADFALKSSKIPDKLIIENLLLSVALKTLR